MSMARRLIVSSVSRSRRVMCVCVCVCMWSDRVVAEQSVAERTETSGGREAGRAVWRLTRVAQSAGSESGTAGCRCTRHLLLLLHSNTAAAHFLSLALAGVVQRSWRINQDAAKTNPIGEGLRCSQSGSGRGRRMGDAAITVECTRVLVYESPFPNSSVLAAVVVVRMSHSCSAAGRSRSLTAE